MLLALICLLLILFLNAFIPSFNVYKNYYLDIVGLIPLIWVITSIARTKKKSYKVSYLVAGCIVSMVIIITYKALGLKYLYRHSYYIVPLFYALVIYLSSFILVKNLKGTLLVSILSVYFSSILESVINNYSNSENVIVVGENSSIKIVFVLMIFHFIRLKTKELLGKNTNEQKEEIDSSKERNVVNLLFPETKNNKNNKIIK